MTWVLFTGDFEFQIECNFLNDYISGKFTLPKEQLPFSCSNYFLLLFIAGPMIEIIREQMVYIAGSNLEVSCVYKNATSVPRNLDGDDSPQANEHVQRLLEATRLLHQPELPEDTIIWNHNALRFSHRNRRRCVDDS